MTEEIFKQQIDVIFLPQVFNYTIGNTTYFTYSQSIPKDAQSEDEIEFYVIMLQEKDLIQQTQKELDLMLY